LEADGGGDPHLPVGEKSGLINKIAGPIEVGPHAPQAQRYAADRHEIQQNSAQHRDWIIFAAIRCRHTLSSPECIH
jgi:hypothetical protein